MAIYAARIEWHDMRIAPEDYPDIDERVLVTTESIDGSRRVQADVFLKEREDGEYVWCTMATSPGSGGMYEETVVWYEVVAWAYYPRPHII